MSREANVQKGAFQLSRSIFESDIWNKPPHFLKVWIWLLGMAFHADTKYLGYNLKRGQYLTSFKETIEATKWKIGYRYKKNTYDEIRRAYEYLREQDMITTTKATPGVIVTICNYDFYQTISNYERQKNARGTPEESQSNATPRYKNEKNERIKEDKKPTGKQKSLSEDEFLNFAYEALTKGNNFRMYSEIRESLKDFYQMRREIGKALKSQKAVTGMIKNIIEFSNSDCKTANEILQQSVANEWQGIFKLNNNGRHTGYQPKTREQRMEELREKTEKMKKEGLIK